MSVISNICVQLKRLEERQLQKKKNPITNGMRSKISNTSSHIQIDMSSLISESLDAQFIIHKQFNFLVLICCFTMGLQEINTINNACITEVSK